MTKLVSHLAVLLGLMALAAGARAEAPTPFAIGLVRLPSSGPVYIAVERGYFRDEGLEPALKFFDSAASVPTAVVSRDLDVGVGGLTAAAFNLAAKGGIKIIASQTREEPGFKLNAFLASRRGWENGYRTLKDMPGRRMGMTTAGSTMHYDYGLIARKYGFELSSVTLVPLQSLSNLYSAFEGGQVDGALLPALPSEKFGASGSGHIIAWAGDVTPYQQGAVITSPATVEQRRPLLERFIRAYQRACGDYSAAFNQRDAGGAVIKGPNYEELIAIIAHAVDQPVADLEGHMSYIDPQARLDVGSFYDQIAFWQQQGVLDKAAKPAPMFDLSFVKEQLNVPAQ